MAEIKAYPCSKRSRLWNLWM